MRVEGRSASPNGCVQRWAAVAGIDTHGNPEIASRSLHVFHGVFQGGVDLGVALGGKVDYVPALRRVAGEYFTPQEIGCARYNGIKVDSHGSSSLY